MLGHNPERQHRRKSRLLDQKLRGYNNHEGVPPKTHRIQMGTLSLK